MDNNQKFCEVTLELPFKSKQSVCWQTLSSAAGRRGDGTVEEWELTGRSVHGDGDGEVEYCAAAADSWTASLWRARRRGQDLGLELQELTHEAEVWGDDAAALLDKLKGLVQLHAVGPHEVGEANGGGAGDAGLTVNKHPASFVSHRVWRWERERERKVSGV